jgi:hypothetical protein
MPADRETAFSTALSFFDGLRTKDLPANLIQAQRDYFGAHTFRIKPEYTSEKYPPDHVRVKSGTAFRHSADLDRTFTSTGLVVVVR